MRAIIPILTFCVAVGALSGCSVGALPGSSGSVASSPSHSSSSAGGGSASSAAPKQASGATSSSECATAGRVLAKFVSGTMSAPYQKGYICYFGVGPNGNKSGATLAQQYGDVVVVQYTTSDVDGEYRAASQNYGGPGIKNLSGVGTKAQYWGGLNNEGSPQVFARTAGAFCLVQTRFNEAAEVGLTSPGGSSLFSGADMPKVAAEVGGVCSALFGN